MLSMLNPLQEGVLMVCWRKKLIEYSERAQHSTGPVSGIVQRAILVLQKQPERGDLNSSRYTYSRRADERQRRREKAKGNVGKLIKMLAYKPSSLTTRLENLTRNTQQSWFNFELASTNTHLIGELHLCWWLCKREICRRRGEKRNIRNWSWGKKLSLVSQKQVSSLLDSLKFFIFLLSSEDHIVDVVLELKRNFVHTFFSSFPSITQFLRRVETRRCASSSVCEFDREFRDDFTHSIFSWRIKLMIE